MAAPPQQRELKYQVTLVTDPRQAVQGMQAVGQSVDAVGKKATAAQIELARLQALQIRQDQQMKGWNPDGSFTPKAVEKAGSAPAALLAKVAFWTQAVGNLTEAAQKLGDNAIGAREKVLGFASSVPIIGDAISSIFKTGLDLIERVRTDIKGGYGTYDARRLRVAALPFDSARDQVQFGRRTRLEDVRAGDELTIGSAVRGVDLARDLNALRFGDPNLSGSEKGYDAAIRSARSSEVGVRGQRDTAAAAAAQAGEMVARQRQVAALASLRANRASAAFGQVAGPINGPDGSGWRTGLQAVSNALMYASPFSIAVGQTIGSGPDARTDPTREKELTEAKLQAEKAQAEAMREQQRLESLIVSAKEKGLALTQAESQLRKANLGVAQAELQIVNQKLDKAKSSAVQFGSFDPAKQQAVIRAVDKAKGEGWKELSPEQKALLSSTTATAEFANKLSENAGDSDGLRYIQGRVGDQDQKTLKAERERLEGSIKMSVELDAQQLQDEVRAKLTDGIGKALLDAIEQAFALRMQEIDIKQRSQRISQK